MSGRPVVLSISIPEPPGAVWAELERIEDHTEWMADAVAIDFLTDQRRGVGLLQDAPGLRKAPGQHHPGSPPHEMPGV